MRYIMTSIIKQIETKSLNVNAFIKKNSAYILNESIIIGNKKDTLKADDFRNWVFTTNEIDSDSAFDGNAFTVPSGEAGKYYFSCQLKHAFASAGNDGERFFVQFRKTSGGVNSTIGLSDFFKASGYNISEATNSLSAIIDLDVGDTVKVLGFNKDGNASANAQVSSDSFFMGFKLIG